MQNSPISLPVNVRKLPKKGSHFKLDADLDQKANLSARYDLIEMTNFLAEAQVTPWRRGGVKIVGRIQANFIQPCAITAEPLSQTLDEDVDALFLPEDSKLARPSLNGEGEIIVDAEGEDVPETFSGDTIDLGEVWLEFFALGLDPFARKENATLPDAVQATPEEVDDDKVSPFAALAALKKQ